MSIYDQIAQQPGSNLFAKFISGQSAGQRDYGQGLQNRLSQLQVGQAQDKIAKDKEVETARRMRPVIQMALSTQDPQERRRILTTAPMAMGNLLDAEDRSALMKISEADDQRLEMGLQALGKYIDQITGDKSTANVQSTVILDNGNIGTVMRDGQVVDTGTRARGFAQRPIETDAGVYNFNPAQGTVNPRPLVSPEQISRGAAQKAGAVTTAQGTAKTQTERAAAQPKAEAQVSSVTEKTRMLNDLIDQAKGQADFFTTGLIGAGMKKIPGTDAYDLFNTLDTIRANIGFDKLQQLRDESPTGGALGQVSERENTLLQAVWGALEQSQSKAQFLSNLERVKRQVKQSWDRVARAYQQTYGKPLPDALMTGGSGDTNGRTVKRTGRDRRTGRRVIEYSDGSLEYAD